VSPRSDDVGQGELPLKRPGLRVTSWPAPIALEQATCIQQLVALTGNREASAFAMRLWHHRRRCGELVPGPKADLTVGLIAGNGTVRRKLVDHLRTCGIVEDADEGAIRIVAWQAVAVVDWTRSGAGDEDPDDGEGSGGSDPADDEGAPPNEDKVARQRRLARARQGKHRATSKVVPAVTPSTVTLRDSDRDMSRTERDEQRDMSRVTSVTERDMSRTDRDFSAPYPPARTCATGTSTGTSTSAKCEVPIADPGPEGVTSVTERPAPDTARPSTVTAADKKPAIPSLFALTSPMPPSRTPDPVTQEPRDMSRTGGVTPPAPSREPAPDVRDERDNEAEDALAELEADAAKRAERVSMKADGEVWISRARTLMGITDPKDAPWGAAWHVFAGRKGVVGAWKRYGMDRLMRSLVGLDGDRDRGIAPDAWAKTAGLPALLSDTAITKGLARWNERNVNRNVTASPMVRIPEGGVGFEFPPEPQRPAR
jgi:hypothetical protein